MLYQSSKYKWLKVEVTKQDNNLILKQNSLLDIFIRLNLKSVTQDININELKQISSVLYSWLRFALMTNITDNDSEITVYDYEYFYQFPLPKISEAKSVEEKHWFDMTNVTANQLPLDFVSFDTETTGTDIKSDKIIQLSAAKYRDGELVDKFDVLVNPRRQLLPKITEITGITTKQVMQAKDFIDIAPDFLKFIQNENLIGQNIIEFDLPLVLRECKDNKLDFGKYKIIDTLPLTRKAFPGRKHYAQEKLDRDFHLSEKVQEKGYVKKNVLHNSLNDSYTTAELYLMDRNALIKEKA